MPERGLVRKGNKLYARELYTRSSEAYQEALLHDSTLFEGRYNLANALIRQAMADSTATQNAESAEANLSQGYLSQAEGLLKAAALDSLKSEDARADAYYNLGNTQFVQQKLQEALSSYRKALTLRPDDMEAKYNYALTKKLLEQNQNQNQDQNQDQNNQNNDQNQNQDQQQDQNNDQNKDQNNDQNQDQQQNQDQNKDGGGDDKEDEKKPNEQPQNRSGMSEEQQKQLLDAIQAQEDKTQDKLDKKAKGVIIKGRKNW
ncbi:MAG: tetratricopeptide repeat protein [Alistipes sp.]|nr:tetratricopeptide repeat protein [Alistipes sp.]